MINRRSFFNILGKAVLGTAIALRLPDNIVPTIKLPMHNGGVLTWSMLDRMYTKFIVEHNKSIEAEFYRPNALESYILCRYGNMSRYK